MLFGILLIWLLGFPCLLIASAVAAGIRGQSTAGLLLAALVLGSSRSLRLRDLADGLG